MDDAAFKRERLQAALEKLRERLAELRYQEEHARRRVRYYKAEAVRDELAKELAEVYPAFAQSSPTCWCASPSMTARSTRSITLCQTVPTACLLPS